MWGDKTPDAMGSYLQRRKDRGMRVVGAQVGEADFLKRVEPG